MTQAARKIAPQSKIAPETKIIPQETLIAFSVLDRIASNYKDVKITLSSWSSLLRARQAAGELITVLEHTTLVYALRTPHLLNPLTDKELIQDMTTILAQSWRQLADFEPSDLLTRLPRKVLRRENHETRVFHAAAFQNRTGLGASKNAGDEAAIGADFVGEMKDLWIALGVLAVACFPDGRQLLAGAGVGYTVATLLEMGFHGYLAHAPQQINAIFKKIGGRLEGEFNELKYSHVGIHHDKTFRAQYNVQFSTFEERKSVEKLAFARGPSAARNIIQSRYGNSLSPHGIRNGLLVGVPVSLAVLSAIHLLAPITGFTPSLVFDGVAFALSLLNIPATGIFHAYMHMSHWEAAAKSGPVMRWFLRSRYTAMMSRLHYGHHRGRGGNYNLVFGADSLFGTLRKPTVKQLLEMKKFDLIY